MTLFPHYPADSDSVRECARQSRNAAGTIATLIQEVSTEHRTAVEAVTGDLDAAIGPMIGPFMGSATSGARTSIWAACQLERFADAIDVYDHSSTQPRSIDKLNEAYSTANAEREDLKDLQREWGLLEANLDEAAAEIASCLDREPTDAEIHAEWAAGNLPLAAIDAWPDLGLSLLDIPFDATNTAITAESLVTYTTEEQAALIADPNLNAEVREMLLAEFPAAVELFSEQWAFGQDTAVVDTAMINCTPNPDGMIVGPDGHLYQLAVPEDLENPQEPIITAPGDSILDESEGGWTTVDSRTGEVAFGDEVGFDEQVAYVIIAPAGLGKPLGDWQALTDDPSSLLVIEDGTVRVVDGTDVPGGVDRPKMGPIPGLDPIPGVRPQHPDGYSRHYDPVWLAIGGLEGATNATQAEYNRHWATEVVFQVNEEGERRAVINYYQVQTDGEYVRVAQVYGVVGEDGTVVPQA